MTACRPQRACIRPGEGIESKTPKEKSPRRCRTAGDVAQDWRSPMPDEYTGNRLRHVSYSELSTYRQCPHKHKLAYLDRWTPPEVGAALTRGKLFHEVLAEHYGALRDGRINEAPVVIESIQDDETRELIRWMYDGYNLHYGEDPEWMIKDVEKTDEVWLPTEDGKRSTYRLKMIIDLLIRDDRGRLWLVDHKTGADFPKETGLDLDDQFSLYAWGQNQLRDGGAKRDTIYGVIYNAIRTRRNKGPMSPEDRFKRIPMYRTAEQLHNTAVDAWRTTRRMRSAEWAERTTNSDTCLWRCSFTEACLWGRKGGDEEEFLTAAGFTQDRDR
jgi:hypothetical protein